MKRFFLPALAAVLLASLLIFCIGLFRFDNKYTRALAAEPGLAFLQEDPETPAFLVDGWEYYPGELLTPEDFAAGRKTDRTVYAGQYSNFSEALGTPYGTATYRLVLENTGPDATLALYVPELLCAGRIFLNGVLAGEQGSIEPYKPTATDGVYSFTLEDRTEILIQCANYTHYYGGLYYPPAVGTPRAILRMVSLRLLVYGAACFGTLTLGLFHLVLWLRRRGRPERLLGVLCLACAGRLCHPFLHSLGVPAVRLTYALEDACGGVMLLCTVLLAGLITGMETRRFHRSGAVPVAASLCAARVVFPLFILPYAPDLINLYGTALFVCELLAGGYLLFLAFSGMGLRKAGMHVPGSGMLLCFSAVYGLCVILSAATATRFEPACGLWPAEYGSLALAMGFAALMQRRTLRIQAENERLTRSLQDEVERQTQALRTLLSERRELLANLLHDVKNPLAAVRAYADLVRRGNVSLDSETAACLDALAERLGAVERRLNALQGFSRRERGISGAQRFCLQDFLRAFYEANRPDMELSGQAFNLCLTEEPLYVKGDREQLRTALENLCYNALSFTPEEGSITLSLRREGGWAVVEVRDTGCGIRPEDLPHVFERGFSRREDDTGEGLGLAIVRDIALEHGGSVQAASEPGKGSVFSLHLPLASGES